MNTTTAPPLPLAQLHLPPEPGALPLAWGWWLVIAVSAFVLIFLVLFIYKRRKARLAQKQALKELNNCENIKQINSLLKRAALSYFPRSQVASLTGVTWLSFLDAQLSAKKGGFVQMQQLWLASIFNNQPTPQDTLEQAKKLARNWLKKGLPLNRFQKKITQEVTHV